MNDSLQSSRESIARAAPLPALGHFLNHFLNHCLTTYAAENSGAAANYIPELSKANPAHFGIGLATIDGHVYEAGDSAVEFTIQSISKAFVFALALDLVGPERVEAKIGVEPSGEAFNSIRLTADNRPFNAMVNAGAIACSGLIHSVDGSDAFERVRDALSRFAGRELGVDQAVFESERTTGDRNRAIAFLLHNYSVIEGNVSEVLDVYFKQCSILVTARDLAVMAATLESRHQSDQQKTGRRALRGRAHAVGDDFVGYVRLRRRMGLPRRHPCQERRRRRHNRRDSGAIRAGHVLAAARQPRQQRARDQSLRGPVVAFRTARAQPFA